ncbi:MAG: hypothetical protein HYY51_02065 [Candidatus Magasanikbacteria bacterium]|nr:hypothetical protein [Candidatus Magasanikbacteria bacterium]
MFFLDELKKRAAALWEAAFAFLFFGTLLTFIVSGLMYLAARYTPPESYWGIARQVASMFLGLPGGLIFFLGVFEIERAVTERSQYIDDDIGSIERSAEDRWLQAIEGLVLILIGVAMVVITVLYLV